MVEICQLKILHSLWTEKEASRLDRSAIQSIVMPAGLVPPSPKNPGNHRDDPFCLSGHHHYHRS